MIPDQPRLNYYDRETFWKIDWRALPADVLLVVFGIVISRRYFAEDNIINSLSPGILLGLFMLVVVTICWYLGFMMARYRNYYGQALARFSGVIFSLAGFTLLVYLFRLMNPLLQSENTDESSLGMIAIFLLVLGPFIGIGGYMTGRQIQLLAQAEAKEPAGGKDETYYGAFIALLAAVVFLVKTVSSSFVQDSSIDFIWFILCFIGSAFVGALTLALLISIKKLLNRFGLYYRLAFIFETLFPCIVLASLIFWNEIQKHYLSGLSGAGIVGVLFFTGIIPFRFLLVFNPPLRFFNLASGIFSLAFYIYCLLLQS